MVQTVPCIWPSTQEPDMTRYQGTSGVVCSPRTFGVNQYRHRIKCKLNCSRVIECEQYDQ